MGIVRLHEMHMVGNCDCFFTKWVSIDFSTISPHLQYLPILVKIFFCPASHPILFQIRL